MNTFTFSGDSFTTVSEQINQILEKDFSPTLAIVFSSVSQEYQAITNLLNAHGIDVFGATTAGEICNDEVSEYSVSGMIMDMNRSYYQIYKTETGSISTYQIARETAVFAKSQFNDPALIVASGGLSTDGEEIIRGIKDIAGEDIALYGALAADDFLMENSFVFSNDWQTTDGLLTLIIDQDKINVEGRAVNGWESVGVAKTITHSEGNIVYEIDGEPALDVFIRYFGLSRSLNGRTDVISSLGAQYPLQVERDNQTSVIRAPMMGNNEDGSMIFAGGVPNGGKVKFSIPPGFDIIERAIEDTSELKKNIPNADAMILFSCKARHLALGPLVEEEVSGIRKLWDAPMVGFFAYGEIGKAKDSSCDFHNESCSLVVLQEK